MPVELLVTFLDEATRPGKIIVVNYIARDHFAWPGRRTIEGGLAPGEDALEGQHQLPGPKASFAGVSPWEVFSGGGGPSLSYRAGGQERLRNARPCPRNSPYYKITAFARTRRPQRGVTKGPPVGVRNSVRYSTHANRRHPGRPPTNHWLVSFCGMDSEPPLPPGRFPCTPAILLAEALLTFSRSEGPVRESLRLGTGIAWFRSQLLPHDEL